MQLSYLLLFSLVALVSANPLPNSDSTATIKCSSTITANYDDLPRRPPAAVPIPIGPYRGLKYNNILLITVGTPPAGLMPASSPNEAGFGIFAVASTPNVTVFGGGGGGYKTFNPIRIAYACAVGAEESVVSGPTSCTIASSGYKTGVRVVRQSVKYRVATGQVNKAMSVASLQGFRGVDTVGIELVGQSLLTVAIRLDDFVYAGCS